MFDTLRSTFLCSILLFAVTQSCTGPPERPADDPTESVAVAEPVTEGAAFEQVEWLLGITDVAAMTDEEVLSHFHASFIDEMTVMGTEAIVAIVVQQTPAAVDRYRSDSTAQRATAAVVHDGKWYSLRVSTHEEDGTITGLSFNEAPQLNPNWSWELFRDSVQILAPRVNYLAAELVGGECVPVHSLNPDTSLAVGSSFKLWILTELAAQVIAGERSWDDILAIRDEWKSTPTGEMQNLPVGTEHTLQHYAEQMISISDNTATDHLLQTLGRERVEAAVVRTGHHDPSELAPFLATTELFALKLLQTPEQRQAYLTMSTEERRRYLDEDLPWDNTAGLFAAMMWTAPRDIELEWYASATDLCNVMVHLQEQSTTAAGAAVSTVLSINPGFPLDPQIWPFVGYKGGSEPGVFNFTWLLRRADDRWFVFSAGLNDPEEVLDFGPIGITLFAGMSLLEDE